MRRRLGAEEAPAIIRMMLSAVIFLHEQGKRHSSLRLNNFIFAADSDLKLCDLGPTNRHLLGDKLDDHRANDSWALGAMRCDISVLPVGT